ncbi:hypothetical protein BGZ50_002206 [Haplosporangium sp. Z 11]|nr:hypothetical protein BGZ50_002206 [Haplosporangium sp. Z 11]
MLISKQRLEERAQVHRTLQRVLYIFNKDYMFDLLSSFQETHRYRPEKLQFWIRITARKENCGGGTARAAATICGISLPILLAATKTSRPGSFKTTALHHAIDDPLCFSIKRAQREGRAKGDSGILVNPLLVSLLGSQFQFIRILSQQMAAATSTGEPTIALPTGPEDGALFGHTSGYCDPRCPTSFLA